MPPTPPTGLGPTCPRGRARRRARPGSGGGPRPPGRPGPRPRLGQRRRRSPSGSPGCARARRPASSGWASACRRPAAGRCGSPRGCRQGGAPRPQTLLVAGGRGGRRPPPGRCAAARRQEGPQSSSPQRTHATPHPRQPTAPPDRPDNRTRPNNLAQHARRGGCGRGDVPTSPLARSRSGTAGRDREDSAAAGRSVRLASEPPVPRRNRCQRLYGQRAGRCSGPTGAGSRA